jgi:hypothetical protein
MPISRFEGSSNTPSVFDRKKNTAISSRGAGFNAQS